MIRRQPPAGARRQRGAILIMTAAFIVAAVALLALAIDTGRLYAAQAKLQSVTNLAALNAARVAGGCKAGIGSTKNNNNAIVSAVNAAVTNTIEANQGSGTQIDTRGAPVLGNTALGTVGNKNEGLRGFIVNNVDAREADTVQVTLQRDAPTPLINFFTASDKPLKATAAARQRPLGALQLDNSLLNLNSNQSPLLNSVLGQMLGTSLNLTAASYEGLANTYIKLLDLADVTAGVITPEDLLSTEVDINSLMDAVSQVTDTAGVNVNAQGEVTLGNLLHVEENLSTGPGSVNDILAEVPINALGLISALAQTSASQRNEVIRVGDKSLLPLINGVVSAITLGTVTPNLSLQLGVIEPPQLSGIGRPGYDAPNAGDNTEVTGSTNEGARTWASTSPIHLNLDAKLTIQTPGYNGILGIGGTGIRITLKLPVYLHVAKSYAILDKIDCATAANPENVAHVVARTGLAELGVGHYDNLFDPNPIPNKSGDDLLDIGAKVAGLGLKTLTVPMPNANPPLSAYGNEKGPDCSLDPKSCFNSPFVPEISEPSKDNTHTITTASGQALGELTGRLTNYLTEYLSNADLGGALGGVLDPVLDLLGGVTSLLDYIIDRLLTPLLSALGSNLLDPLLKVLGVQLGAANITITKVDVNQPQLICTSKQACEQLQQ